MFVSSFFNNKVVEFDVSGSTAAVVQSLTNANLVSPTGLAVDPISGASSAWTGAVATPSVLAAWASAAV